MARVLYGIHGTGHGHAMRGLTLARAMPWHEFLFIANDDAPKVLEPEFKVHRLPNLGTVFKNYKADIPNTIFRAIPTLIRRKQYIEQTLRLIDDFRPDVCLTDLEYFVPKCARIAGLPCLTLDHQHIITCCKHELPPGMLWDTFLQGLTPKYLFPPTEANIIISFYAPPVLPQYNAIVAPPILRQNTIDIAPTDHGHILVYQSNSTDDRLIDFLMQSNRVAHVFGYKQTEGRKDNIIFHKRSENEFLNLLASCAYVIQGGSHTLMSEALYLGKAILSIPLRAMIEQRFNALYLERLGYGKAAAMNQLNPDLLASFESNLPAYLDNISRANFCGNPLVFDLVNNFITSGKIPKFSRSRPAIEPTKHAH